MAFLPKHLRTQELFGLLAAVPAAVVGSALFLYMLDLSSRLTA